MSADVHVTWHVSRFVEHAMCMWHYSKLSRLLATCCSQVNEAATPAVHAPTSLLHRFGVSL